MSIKRIVVLLILLNVLLMYYLYMPEKSSTKALVGSSEVRLKKSAKQLEAEYRLSMPEDVCFSIGPFEKTFVADRVMGELAAKGVPNERRTYADANNFETNFVVYLPPQKNRMEAIKVERKLKEQGIRESYVISTGVNKDAIFLGIYSQENLARRQLNEILNLGYRAKLEPRKTARNLYWLDIRSYDPQINNIKSVIQASLEGLKAKVLSGNC